MSKYDQLKKDLNELIEVWEMSASVPVFTDETKHAVAACTQQLKEVVPND